MAQTINLQQLGQTMEEGTIVNCRVNVGDKVKKGDCLFEIETDKATLEMESPAEGFVKKILVAVGQTIPVNEPMIILGDKDEIVADGKAIPENKPAAKAETPRTAAETKTETKTAPKAQADRTFASPRAKMTASQLGVDITKLTVAADKPRITEKDVRLAAQSMPESGIKLGQTVPLSKIQKLTGQRMLQSKQQIPCFYLNASADMTELAEHRANRKAAGVNISFNDFVIKAIGMALRQFPIMAGQLEGDKIKIADKISVGLAIAVGDDLVAPLCKDPDIKSVEEIAAYNKALIEKAKANKLTPDDFEGGCITLSNLGGFGIESFIPIVVPGQCSILGIGQIIDTPVVRNGSIVIRKMMAMTLSVDHKVANGAYAAQFLDYIKNYLSAFPKK